MNTQPAFTNRSVFFLIGVSALSVTALIIGPLTPDPVHGGARPRQTAVEQGKYLAAEPEPRNMGSFSFSTRSSRGHETQTLNR